MPNQSWKCRIDGIFKYDMKANYKVSICFYYLFIFTLTYFVLIPIIFPIIICLCSKSTYHYLSFFPFLICFVTQGAVVKQNLSLEHCEFSQEKHSALFGVKVKWFKWLSWIQKSFVKFQGLLPVLTLWHCDIFLLGFNWILLTSQHQEWDLCIPPGLMYDWFCKY